MRHVLLSTALALFLSIQGPAAAPQEADRLTEPRETRAKVAAALEALADKEEERPWKKHGNIPM